jgi:Flp pilus assembly protein CpaB
VAPQGDDPLSLYLQTLPAGSSFTQTIFQAIPVLSVGGLTETSPAPVEGEVNLAGEVSVVLEVTTEQAEQLELARQVSVLALALLPAEETYAPFDARGALTADVFDFFERIRADLEAIGVG